MVYLRFSPENHEGNEYSLQRRHSKKNCPNVKVWLHFYKSNLVFFTYRAVHDDLDKHREFFSKTQVNYHIDHKNRIFIHGGFTHPKGPSYDLIKTQCLWDRSLWNDALIGQKLKRKPHILSGFTEIYIGHTPTLNWFKDHPMNAFNVWNLDTGAGHSGGKLTIMDIDTKEFWQSDISSDLYRE